MTTPPSTSATDDLPTVQIPTPPNGRTTYRRDGLSWVIYGSDGLYRGALSVESNPVWLRARLSDALDEIARRQTTTNACAAATTAFEAQIPAELTLRITQRTHVSVALGSMAIGGLLAATIPGASLPVAFFSAVIGLCVAWMYARVRLPLPGSVRPNGRRWRLYTSCILGGAGIWALLVAVVFTPPRFVTLIAAALGGLGGWLHAWSLSRHESDDVRAALPSA